MSLHEMLPVTMQTAVDRATQSGQQIANQYLPNET